MTRVCLIDDDHFVRDALALGLSDAGFDVVTAPGAAAGLDIAMRQEIDVIVTDLSMPGTDGAQLIADLRARWPLLPIIAISGASVIDGRSVPEIAGEAGADTALIKPFRAAALADAIKGLIAKRSTPS